MTLASKGLKWFSSLGGHGLSVDLLVMVCT